MKNTHQKTEIPIKSTRTRRQVYSIRVNPVLLDRANKVGIDIPKLFERTLLRAVEQLEGGVNATKKG